MNGAEPFLGSSFAAPPVRRVRHEVRDGLAVMLFSLATSTVLALLLLLLTTTVGN